MHPEALTEEGKKLWPLFGEIPSGFYLAGGTALALQIGHRVSVDFDFFSNDYLPNPLLPRINKIFGGHSLNLAVNNPDELTVFVDGIKLTFLRYPFPPIKEFVDFEGIKLLDAVEIAVTKAYTIGRRGSFKDYVDVYFVLVSGLTNLEEIINLAEQKYNSDFNARLFLEQLVYFTDISDESIRFLKEPVDKETIKNFFEDKIRKIEL